MSAEPTADQKAEDLGARRADVLERLTQDTGALSAARHKLGPLKVEAVVLGAAVGGAVVVLALAIDHRRRERNRPLRRLEHAWTQLTRSRRPSLFARFVKSGLGALATTVASEAGEMILQHVRAKLDQVKQDAAHTPCIDPAHAAPAVARPSASSRESHDARLPTTMLPPPVAIQPTVVAPMHELI